MAGAKLVNVNIVFEYPVLQSPLRRAKLLCRCTLVTVRTLQNGYDDMSLDILNIDSEQILISR